MLAEGRLTLVDLAGSERQQALLDASSKAGMAESVQINKSLFTLRKVILSLSEGAGGGAKGGAAHVPYRDSTLTRLLKNALGGNCHTLSARAASRLAWSQTLAYVAQLRTHGMSRPDARACTHSHTRKHARAHTFRS